MAARKSSVSWLSDDEVGLIVKWLTISGDSSKSFSEVCKQWWRVEGLNRTSIRLLQLDNLRRVLPRFPYLVKFETSKCITKDDLEFLAQTCPKITNIDLGKPRDEVQIEPRDSEIDVMYALAHSCPTLLSVSLRNRGYSGEAITPFIKAQNTLMSLDLGHCCVLDETLEAIRSLSCLFCLNLEGCDRITDLGLGFLANGSCSKTLKKLVLAGCSRITDSGASILQKMSCLEVLSLDPAERFNKYYFFDGRFSEDRLRAVMKIQTLEKLNFGNNCYVPVEKD